MRVRTTIESPSVCSSLGPVQVPLESDEKTEETVEG